MRRNSNSSKNRRGKIPIPVSVTCHNLCPRATSEAQLQSQSKKWFRPEHAMSLLHHALLEIVITPPGEVQGEGETKASEGEEEIIFSSLAPLRTVNPRWNNLNECIEDALDLDGYLDSETGRYRFMRLKIWLLSEKEVETSGKDGNSDTKNDKNLHLKKAGDDPLLDIGIHPTKLHRLAKLPQQLPVNSLIFHFSDDSIRATQALLLTIGDQDGSHADEDNKDEFGRFGDDVFRTLDQVTPVKKPTTSKGENKENPIASILAKTSSEDSQEGEGMGSSSHCEKQQRQELLSVMETKFAAGESEAAWQDSGTEQRRLKKLIQLEEEALEKAMLALQEEKAETQSLMEKSSRYESDLSNLEEGIKTEKQLCRQSDFFLEARRVKLLLDLRTIYPITFLRGEDRYSIRDLCIPMDIHSGAVTEEELSAALGFLCHLVSMVSKYMSVQLRHRVFCNSSRSAVQEDGGAIFPLFQARVVERDQLDHGVLLLRRNVECILKTRDIEYQPKDHILANVKRLFDVMIDAMD